MPTNIMHPALSQLISLENIPNDAEGLGSAISSVFDDVFVKNLIFGLSPKGEAGFYTLVLVSFNGIGLNIPLADDLKLVLNPGVAGTTELPLYCDFKWFIKQYMEEFSIDGFDNSALSLLSILSQMAGITAAELLGNAIEVFYEEPDDISTFISDFNSAYGGSIALDSNPFHTPTDQIESVARDIADLNLDVSLVIFELLIDLPGENAFERVKMLFADYYDAIDENFSEAIKLQFQIFINDVNLGLQFPRNWLIPVYTGIEPEPGLEINDPLPEGYYSILSYHVGRLGYSSKRGFVFEQIDSFQLNRSIIGQTGLIAEFQGLKVDLQRDENIPEANADDRPLDFRGAFAQYASITLPARWFNSIDNTTLRIAGYNLLIGTGGISGTIGIETVNGTPSPGDDYLDMKIGNWEIGFNHFAMNFKQNVITDSHIAGRLKIPKLKDAQGNDAIVYVNGHLNETGDFNLTASEPEGIPFHIFDFVTINMQTIELGRQDDLFYLGASAEIWFDNALMNKLLGGQKITVPKIRIYENGKFEIVGGASTIPANITLNLGPVEVAVTETIRGMAA